MSQRKAAQPRFPRGSEWRRWDLHVHTPESALNCGFGEDFDAYAKALFEKAIDRKIAVVGVTDYFSIAGYKKLRTIQRSSKRLENLLGSELVEPAQQIRLLANIEFRLSDFVRVGEQDSRVNAHVIFSDAVPPREIEENFLQRLDVVADSAPGDLDSKKPLTIANLKDFGATLKNEHAHFASRSDLEVGMTQAAVSHTEISERLAGDSVFTGRFIFAVAADEDLADISWNGQGHSTRKALIRKSHMLFSANPGTYAFALGQRAESVAAHEAEFRGRKACIHGSDAHDEQSLFLFAKDRQLWIRADPTFDGLMHVNLEPEDRVFIGPEPPSLQRVMASATKSIDQVSFARDRAAGASMQWFTGAVRLNPGLVALIGKKGSGKSALADVIGLIGDAQTAKDFSFLNPLRFLNPRHGLGHHFTATLRWRSKETESRRLDEGTDPDIPERVRHIPQNYLEKVCAEIQDASKPTLFDEELESVIFSHVPKADRLGMASLADLFHHTTEATEAEIVLLRGKLEQLNRDYVELRRRSSTEAQRRLTAELSQRRAALQAHLQAKPKEVIDPSSTGDASAEATQAEQDLGKTVAKIEELDAAGKELRAKQETGKRRQVAAERLIARIANLATVVEEFYAQSADDSALLSLDTRQLVRVETELDELKALHEEIVQEMAQIGEALDGARTDSTAHERKAASKRADELRKQLAEPQRRYQEYRRALARWETEKAEIEGSVDEAKSVKGLEAQLAAFSELPELAKTKREEREALVAKIFAAKAKLLDSYRGLYRPVERFAVGHPVAKEVSALSFDAVIAVDGLEDGLLSMIDQRRKGSFQGDQDGHERLRLLIARHEFGSAEGVAAFLAELGEHLDHDLRYDSRPAVQIAEQLMRNASVEGLYDFLFGLEYLKPRFKLLWRGKPLDQLSPGERGTLLLIFYLLIDLEDVPLVIDQPEENLDNETIAELLVPAVKYAKNHRQIVLVTHNPNLAVVCDADQVIHASIDKADGNRVTYTSGAIEDPVMTQLIVDVLEGTKPAFDLRDAKYEVLDRRARSDPAAPEPA